MNKEAITSEKIVPAQGPHSNAVRSGSLLFIAGQGARDQEGKFVGPGDPVAQAEQVLKNIGALLEASGASFDNVMMLRVYVTDMRCREALGKVRRQFMREPFPASTTIQVANLALPEQLVMMEAIAVL
ncbi:MAG: RidA family protein [Dehalococcoidia bacterium]|nr:RidA family protein [Dehalococcoidia bacterium]